MVSANTLRSALPEMDLSSAQMAVIKVLLPRLEVFDLGDFYLRELTQGHCWKVYLLKHSSTSILEAFLEAYFVLFEVIAASGASTMGLITCG